MARARKHRVEPMLEQEQLQIAAGAVKRTAAREWM